VERSMARFLPSSCKFSELYECRAAPRTSGAKSGVQGLSEPRIYPRLQSWWRVLAQCRGTNCHGARNLSWCRILIACRCACPGATAITNLSWVQE
jgi:hypothetical protein